ncbi:MAG: PLP-dependent aminotransferase family protein [Spirochaetia bacterium]|jgi:GntR family transcriptional regulator/MocR family aminotransferase
MWAENLIITLGEKTRESSRPWHRQVFTQIRDAIRDGRLRSGDRLPATRELARTLGVARNTVARAYEDLLAEGYIEGRIGSGTYVSDGLGELPRDAEEPWKRRQPSVHEPGKAYPEPHLTWLGGPESTDAGSLPIDFRPGIPDWDAFPRGLWLRLLGRALRSKATELRRYSEPGGHYPLRDAIAHHLGVSRGVTARPEQVVIVNGSQQALDLIARLFLKPGDTVALEDPGYPDARRVLAGPAHRQLFVPVDEDGIDVDALEKMTSTRVAPCLLYVTPSHQFPTGAVLSLSRRLALLSWAARRNVLIVEDDYDSEFRTPGRLVESLQGLDRSRKVVYVGTFSTVLFPPLRVGYVVLPIEMAEPFMRAKWLADRQTPILEQLALTDFLQEGHFERHLRRMRRLVSARREAMRAALEKYFGNSMEASDSSVGMHVMVRLTATRRGMAAAEIEGRILAAAAERGIAVYPVGPCFSRPPLHAIFLLGYAALSEDLIREGVEKLAKAVAAALSRRR